MAVVTIITKNNDGAGVVPSPGSLVEGELAVNTTDRKLYTLNNAGSVVLLASGTSYSDPVVIDVSSASPAVRITQRGAGYALLVEDSANPDSTPFAVDATGNVGIGTTSITEKLTIAGNASLSNNLVFSGTGNRILGDFSNATVANRVAFQTNTVNGATRLNLLPNGTGVATEYLVFNSSDPANSSFGSVRINASDFAFQSMQNGSGTFLPMTFYTFGSEKFRIAADATGTFTFGGTAPRIIGDFSNATIANRVMFQTSTTNSGTFLYVLPNGTSTSSGYTANSNSTDPANASEAFLGVSSTAVVFNSNIRGTGTYLPMTFSTGGSEAMRIDTSRNVLVGGTASRGTTVGTAHLDLFNGTAPAGTLTNGVSLYSSSGDFNFMDSAGNGYKVGFRNVPAVGTKTSSYTLATADVGKYVQVGSGGSIIIPDATFAEGDVISIFNNTSGNITLTCSITTAYIAGVDADRATMTLATRGVATVFFISGTVCVVTGSVS